MNISINISHNYNMIMNKEGEANAGQPAGLIKLNEAKVDRPRKMHTMSGAKGKSESRSARGDEEEEDSEDDSVSSLFSPTHVKNGEGLESGKLSKNIFNTEETQKRRHSSIVTPIGPHPVAKYDSDMFNGKLLHSPGKKNADYFQRRRSIKQNYHRSTSNLLDNIFEADKRSEAMSRVSP